MTDDEKKERSRMLDRERGRRYRERNAERVREMSRKRVSEYAKRNPEHVAEIRHKSTRSLRAKVNADPYAAMADKAVEFWTGVESGDESVCWPWTKGRTSQGYGRFEVSGGRWFPASRVALMLSIGRNLEKGEFALHRCDNPICCNPAHLYAGTQRQNIQDKTDRGRHVARTGHKITEETAMKIFNEPGTRRAVADKFGVSQSFVSMVKNGQRWGRIGASITHA